MLFGISFTYIWLILAVILAIIEINTVTLVCIWFIVGSLFAFGVSFITQNILIQLRVFCAVSGVSLAVSRPLSRKILDKKPTPTNADMIIGKECTVVRDITEENKGRVSVGGLTWMAQSRVPLKKGRQAKVLAINGVTLTVEPVTVKV